VLSSPLGVVRLMDLLLEREVLRNEALLLLAALTGTNAEIQKIAAFEVGTGGVGGGGQRKQRKPGGQGSGASRALHPTRRPLPLLLLLLLLLLPLLGLLLHLHLHTAPVP
jgi:hypothetical protein